MLNETAMALTNGQLRPYGPLSYQMFFSKRSVVSQQRFLFSLRHLQTNHKHWEILLDQVNFRVSFPIWNAHRNLLAWQYAPLREFSPSPLQ